MPKTKVCAHCGIRKATDRFYERKPGQLRPECRACTREARLANPNQKRATK